jgi:hypothetical protein
VRAGRQLLVEVHAHIGVYDCCIPIRFQIGLLPIIIGYDPLISTEVIAHQQIPPLLLEVMALQHWIALVVDVPFADVSCVMRAIDIEFECRLLTINA